MRREKNECYIDHSHTPNIPNVHGMCVCVDYGEVEKNNIQLKYPEPSSSQNIMEICICLPLLLISCTRINVIWLHCMKYAT